MEGNNKFDKYINLLEANKNLILTGAPGTGKTYLAKAIAEAMNAEFEFVQFHPSYDYADFVEGLRPTPPDNNGNIGFRRVDGVFKSFCKRAITDVVNEEFTGSDVALFERASQLQSSPKAFHTNNMNVLEKRNSSLTNEEIDDAIRWFCNTMNGKNISTHKEGKPLNIKIEGERIVVYNSNGKSFYISPNTNAMESLKQYLSTRYYFKGKDTYVPSVGKFILENYPKSKQYMNNDSSVFQVKSKTKEERLPFIFIIDEINRGEISKIFGELFFSIDPGYRGIKGRVKTQYQNMITDETDTFYEGFYVPENVYIIGTMNDIDRSVESMDFAMRRRFAWEEIKADENTGMLDDLQEMKDEVLEVMKRLNAAIWNEDTHSGIEGLSASYHIGGSYFSKLQLYLNEDHTNKKFAYKHLWENHLKGVLFEYLRGTLNAMENLKMLEQVYYNKNSNDGIEG